MKCNILFLFVVATTVSSSNHDEDKRLDATKRLRGRDLSSHTSTSGEDDSDPTSPPLTRSADGFHNGDGNTPWSGGSFSNSCAGLQKFYFNYQGGGDNHVKDIGVDCMKNSATMTFQDKSETDNYDCSFKAVELPTPYTTGWITLTGHDCGTVYGEVVPDGRHAVITGFSAGFKNGDHHLNNLKIRISESQNDVGQNSLELYGCLDDKNGDDPFEIRVHYALIRENKIIEYGYTGGESSGGGTDTTRIFPNGIPSDAAPVLTGFYFDFDSRDHHIDSIEVDLSNGGELDGYVNVRYDDKNSDDDYTWSVWAVLITT